MNEIYFAEENKAQKTGLNQCDLTTEEWEVAQGIRASTFITQSSFLLKAEEIVEYYETEGRFPRILMCDEILLSGHDYSSIVIQMLHAIYSVWEKRHGQKLEKSKTFELREDFLSAIEFRVFVVGDADKKTSILVEDDLLNRICVGKHYTTSQWWAYVYYITKAISDGPCVENTTFLPTFTVSSDVFQKFKTAVAASKEWKGKTWIYETQKIEIFQREIVSDAYDIRACECLCVRRLIGNDMCEDKYNITLYPLWGPMSEADKNKLFHDVSIILNSFDRKLYKKFIYILTLTYDWAKDIKLHLCMAIFSLVRMLTDMDELNLPSCTIQAFDLEKISMNYGTISEILPMLEALCAEADVSRKIRKELNSVIEQHLYHYSRLITNKGGCNAVYDPLSSEAYITIAEDYFISLDFRERYQLHKRRVKRIYYNTWTDFENGIYTISNYFNHFKKYYEQYSFENAVDAMLLLVHNGLVGFRALSIDDDCAYLKVGERTGMVAALRISEYMPALVLIERVCEKLELSATTWIKKFGEYLDQNGLGNNCEETFTELTEKIYKCNIHFSDFKMLCNRVNDERGNTSKAQKYVDIVVNIF